MALLPVYAELVDSSKVQKALNNIKDKISDFRPIFEVFKVEFYKFETKIFGLRGPGKYQDLNPKYKEKKIKKWGFDYPILKASGDLARSLLNDNARGSISIIRKQLFIIGTAVKYGIYHQSATPRRKIPHRPFIIFGGPGENTVNPVKGASLRDRWITVIDKYIERVTKGTTTKRFRP